ncbi:MAG: hypothetical protein K0U98_26385 [Deltaproteobacteria bacterium]|nr:hypothetical protein [Deltaproteobacteria bacterium]
MPSKMVTDRQKTALALQAAARRHAGSIAEAFGEKLASTASEGATGIDITNLLIGVGDYLAGIAEAMVQADEAKFGEVHEDRSLRKRHDELAAKLGPELSKVRSAVDAAFGTGASVRVLGLEGPMGRDPLVLHRKAQRAIERLGEGSLDGLSPLIQGLTLEPEALVAQFEPTTEALGAILESISEGNRDVEARLGEKSASLEGFDQQVKWAARLLEGAFGFAGREDLARRARRAVRQGRSGRIVIEVPEGDLVAPPEAPEPVLA